MLQVMAQSYKVHSVIDRALSQNTMLPQSLMKHLLVYITGHFDLSAFILKWPIAAIIYICPRFGSNTFDGCCSYDTYTREGVKRSNLWRLKQEIEVIVCKIVQEIEKTLGFSSNLT